MAKARVWKTHFTQVQEQSTRSLPLASLAVFEDCARTMHSHTCLHPSGVAEGSVRLRSTLGCLALNLAGIDAQPTRVALHMNFLFRLFGGLFCIWGFGFAWG